MIWLFITAGGLIGGAVPTLLGADPLSAWGILTSTVGGILGIWIYKRLDLS